VVLVPLVAATGLILLIRFTARRTFRRDREG
jgi:hypothetical protein